MLRTLCNRTAIIPQGDTGDLTVTPPFWFSFGDKVILEVYDPLYDKVVLTKDAEVIDGKAIFHLTHLETLNLEPREYEYDMVSYQGITYDEEDTMVDASEVNSCFSTGLKPKFIVRK